MIFQNVPACIDGYTHVSVSRSVFVSATRKEATERREGNLEAEEKVIYETNTKRVVDHINFFVNSPLILMHSVFNCSLELT